jgi:tetratricopeptide (TPR) repeat protein
VVFYEMLTGKPAFGKGHPLSTVYSILHDDPPPLSQVRQDCPTVCDGVSARLLSKKPDERFATAGAVLEALSSGTVTLVRRHDVRRARRSAWRSSWPIIAGFAAVVIAAVLSFNDDARRRVASAALAVQRAVTPLDGNGLAQEPRHTSLPDARRLFQIGTRWMALRGSSHLDSAIASYRWAITIDPNYAQAWGGLAHASAAKFDLSDPSPALLARAERAADRAIALDPLIADGYIGKGMVLSSHGSRAAFDSAETALRRGIALDPTSEQGHHVYSLLLTMMGPGRMKEAIQENQAALLSSPLGPPQRSFHGVLLFLQGERTMARDTLRAALGINRDYVVAPYYLGIIEAGDGDFELAADDLELAYKDGPRFPGVRSALAYVDQKIGRARDANSLLASVRADTSNDRARIDRALSWAIMGQVDSAYANLRNDVWDLPTVHNVIVNPLLENFRRDSRYQALAKRIGILP